MNLDFPHANPFAVLDLTTTTTTSIRPKKRSEKKMGLTNRMGSEPNPSSFATIGNVAQEIRFMPHGRSRETNSHGMAQRHHHNGRTFDRHSMTNRIDSPKTITQGWGSFNGKQVWLDDTQAEQDAWKEEANSGTALVGVSSRVPPEEEEEDTITLDEYRRRSSSGSSGSIVGISPPLNSSMGNKEMIQRTVDPTPLQAKPVGQKDQVYFAPISSMGTTSTKHRSHKQHSKPLIDTAFSFAHPEGMIHAMSI